MKKLIFIWLFVFLFFLNFAIAGDEVQENSLIEIPFDFLSKVKSFFVNFNLGSITGNVILMDTLDSNETLENSTLNESVDEIIIINETLENESESDLVIEENNSFELNETVEVGVPSENNLSLNSSDLENETQVSDNITDSFNDSQNNDIITQLVPTATIEIEDFKNDTLIIDFIPTSMIFVNNSLNNSNSTQSILNDTIENAEIEYFYWDRKIKNVYFDELGEFNVKVKVPKNLRNITDEIEKVKNEKSNDYNERLKNLKEELKNKTKNKYSEVEIENVTVIKKIKFRDIEIDDSISLGVEELNESRFVQSYAIDPSEVNFTNATVTVIAKGEKLYKCAEWNFSIQSCYGEWKLFKDDLIPGEEYNFTLTPDDPGFGEEINATNAIHFGSDGSFISNIFNEIETLDNVWSESIYAEEFVRVTYQKNLTNGNIIDVYARSLNETDSWFEIYYVNTTSPLLGVSDFINSTGEWTYIQLNNLSYNSDTFDILIKGGSLQFDFIHDATRVLFDTNLTASQSSISEGESITINGSYEMSGTGGPSGDITIGLNDTANNVLDNSCGLGDTFEITSITQNTCDGCVNNSDGTITFLSPDNGETFDLTWNLHSCPDSADYSPAEIITYEVTATNAILNNSALTIDISGAPSLEILYPLNDSVYNSRSLYIKVEITGNSLDTCWYNLNDVGNVSYNCSIDPSITALEGLNNLSVYVNNSIGVESSDYVEFEVNSSIPLTVSITSPANGSSKTESSPQLTLLALDNNFSSINYTLYIYYENDTLYSVGNNGTLINGTDTEISLSPALTLIGNLTTYKIIFNATDGINNASSNILYYTLTLPAIELVLPENDYWDADGNISFSFEVYDEAFSNVSCSLYIDDVLNQTNDSSLTGGTETIFDVFNIDEGVDKVWKVTCIDAQNNTGEASRTFNVDKTNPVINSISDSPDPVDAGVILNITANVTDNFGIDYVTVNISGPVYYMVSAGGDIYYYEYNTSGLKADYNYSVKAYDNVANSFEDTSGSFNVNTLSLSLGDYYGLNSSLGRINEFNTSNLDEIEYLELNFSISSFGEIFDDWYFNFTANGTNGCSLGNKQSTTCYSYPNWIQFINGTETSTYDGTQGNQGDRIIVTQTGSGDSVNLSLRIDEHYNPNVFKWYDALYNFSDVKWQSGTDQRITKNKMIKVEINQSLVPIDADQYKVDFRVNYSSSSPSQPLLIYICNSSYSSGLPENFAGCGLVVSKLFTQFQDDGTKFRGIFTKNLIDEIGDFKYVILFTSEPNPNKYYYIKTYRVTAPSYTSHWEYSTNQGDVWSNLGDNYETELNINWFYNGVSPTAFVYSLWANTTNGTEEYLQGDITWDINPSQNYVPLVEIKNPIPNETIVTPYNITFTLLDSNDDNLNASLYLYQNGILNKTLATGMNQSNSSYFWNDSTVDGTYNLTLVACELGTTDLFCVNETHQILVDNIILFNATLTDFSGNPINSTCTIIYENGTVLHNSSDILHEEEIPLGNYTVIVNPMNNIIKEIYFENFSISDYIFDFLRIDDPIDNQNYSELYVIDPSMLNFSIATVTINQTQGNALYKCYDWNETSDSCNEICETDVDTDCHENWEFVQSLGSGEYNFTIDPVDPAFIETSEAVDLSIAPINNTAFVVAWIDNVDLDLSFRVMNTNGSIIVNTIDVDTTVDIASRVSVSMINSTHFTLGYVDGPDDDATMAIYNVNGSQVLAPTDVDVDVGDNTDVSVAQMGDRFAFCYANDQDNDADFKIYNNVGTELVAETSADNGMTPSLTLQNLIGCSGINSTRFVYSWFDDLSNDASFEILSEAGSVIVGEVDLDADIGETGQIATTNLDNNKFATVFYDSTDQDITLAIRDVDNNVILAPTDIDTVAGIESRVAIGTVRESGSSFNSFVVSWWDQDNLSIRAQVFNGSGSNTSDLITIDTQQDATYRLIDIVGEDPITSNTLCPGTFTVGYTNSSNQGIFKNYYLNGTEWDGQNCLSANTCTYSGSGNWVVDCSDNCVISSNVDVLGNNISITGFGSFSTTANITNFIDLFIAGDSSLNRCEVYCSGGGCFK